jgi:hypothetical protein
MASCGKRWQIAPAVRLNEINRQPFAQNMFHTHRVIAKQPNSKMCLVCGLQNDPGLKAAFYELESQQLVGLFTPRNHQQGYPGRLHGGIAASMLDETIGRAIRLAHGNALWGVTIALNVKFPLVKRHDLGGTRGLLSRHDREEAEDQRSPEYLAAPHDLQELRGPNGPTARLDPIRAVRTSQNQRDRPIRIKEVGPGVGQAPQGKRS